MMTVVVEEFEQNDCYVSLSIENRWNRNIYVASFYEKCGGEYRYPTNQMSYPIEDKKKAYATYRRYKKKCIETEIEYNGKKKSVIYSWNE